MSANFIKRTFIALTSLLLVVAVGCKANQHEAKTISSKRVLVTRPPTVNKHLYPPPAEATVDFTNALLQAQREHKRVLVDFGSDWCGDCQVLDIYFHQAPNDSLLESFVKVNINVGHIDTNLDIARKCKVQIDGVPALAVLDPNGNVLTAQGHQFSNMRYMEPTAVTEFLNQWKL